MSKGTLTERQRGVARGSGLARLEVGEVASPRMNSQSPHRRHFERQLTYARPVIALLALLALVEHAATRQASSWICAFLLGYLAFALGMIALQHGRAKRELHIPLAVDLAAFLVFLFLSPSQTAVWFPFLFVAFAAGGQWGMRPSVFLTGACTLALVLRPVMQGEMHWTRVIGWAGLVVTTFAAGAGLAFLGDLSRRYTEENEFLSRLTAPLQVERGLAESLRILLNDLANAFQAEGAMLAYRDQELERIFLWHVRAGSQVRISPVSLPITRADGFLMDDLDASVCWNSTEGKGQGFGWDRRNGKALENLPRVPGPTQKELKFRSLMTVPFDEGQVTAGRLFLLDARRSFEREDLRWFERIARHLSAPLENLFLLRHMRARAIEGERSRISRDLHDGILQTLLSIEIQLDVLRRKLPAAPEQVGAGLASLQQTVRNESAELRRMVTDLRPLRVQSADLTELMRGYAERFRNECTTGLDLLINTTDIQAPDRVCREIFQIYREALNNIKKHARASHVVVKLSQDDSRIVLVVDDNGSGFSFAGRFSGDELDRLRLGPISIKERTRTVGGVLTVESNPGHGARLTVEISLG